MKVNRVRSRSNRIKRSIEQRNINLRSNGDRRCESPFEKSRVARGRYKQNAILGCENRSPNFSVAMIIPTRSRVPVFRHFLPRYSLYRRRASLIRRCQDLAFRAEIRRGCKIGHALPREDYPYKLRIPDRSRPLA